MTCSTSHPSGNLVGGLPLAAHYELAISPRRMNMTLHVRQLGIHGTTGQAAQNKTKRAKAKANKAAKAAGAAPPRSPTESESRR